MTRFFHFTAFLVGLVAVCWVGIGYIGTAALVVLLLSQLAVIWPAWRAASIPPAIASRGL